MAAKRLSLGRAARSRLLEGARLLAGAVRPTLGPGGRIVILERPMFRAPLATKDGVTVAEEVELEDPIANMGAALVLESAVKTASSAGDGTTSATLLAHAIYRAGEKLIAAGFHPIDLKRGVEQAIEAVVGALAKMARPAVGKREIARIATVSANGDTSVGKLIARAVGEVGLNGILHVEQGTALETKLEVAEGVEIERGFLSPYFITDKERMLVELDEPLVLLCQDKLTRVGDLVPILEQVKATGRSLLVVGEALGDAQSLLVVNQLEGTMKVCGVMPPYYLERRRASLGDLAAQTGGQVVVGQGVGITLAQVTLQDLGQAKRVVVTQEKTTILGGGGRKRDVEARAREVRALYEATESTFKRQELDERLRRLVGGAAVIRVGGTTDPETRERRARIEDAVFATRAAIEEGIVPGGGVALLRASRGLERLAKGLPVAEAAGVRIVAQACAVPCRQIARNAGENPSLVVARVRRGKGGFGFNAANGAYEDLERVGVIDPAMVVRLALQHAASVATLLLTSEACIVDAPRDPVDFPESGSGHDALSVEPFLSRRR